MSDAYDAHLAVRLDRHTGSLVLHTRFRDAAEGSFRLSWDFTDTEVRSRIVPRDDAAYLLEVIDALVERGGFQPGERYTFSQFKAALNMEQGPAMALRARLLNAGLVDRPADKKGIIIT